MGKSQQAIMKVTMSTKLGISVRQVNRKRARRLFNEGIGIFLHPSYLPFDSKWQSPVFVRRNPNYQEDFDEIVGDFERENCNRFNGTYTHYFIKE